MSVSVLAKSGCFHRSPTLYGIPLLVMTFIVDGNFLNNDISLSNCLIIDASSMNPFSANAIAGANTSLIDIVPWSFKASSKPATEPGTPEANAPSRIFSFRTFPLASRNMSLFACLGAFSRKSYPID